MTCFKALFKQMFGQKRRYADLVLLLQVFAVLFLVVLTLLDKKNFDYLNISENSNLLDCVMSAGMVTTPIADVAFIGLLCWQNEKINLSQTWQLAPASSVKIWLTNILTSFVECIYIFVIQVILGLLVAMADNLSHHFPVMHALIDSNMSWSDIRPVFEFLLFLTGMVLIIFTFVSFANFLTRAILDQLPFNNNIVIKLFVMAIIVVIAVLIAGRLNDQITAMYLRHIAKEEVYDLFGVSAAEYFADAIILGIFNCLLISKLVEPKIVNR